MTVDHNREPITISITHDPDVNYALQQNHVPLVKRLNIRNQGSGDVFDVHVSVTTCPEFTVPWETTVAGIPAGAEIEIAPVDIMCRHETLAAQQERESGALVVKVTDATGTLAEARSGISILAHDEWGGANVIPEIISAFVTPSHPYVARIIGRASQVLGEWTGDPSIDGYQSGTPVRPRQILAAIHAAIQEYEISYCVPPPSFEESGQKIRTPDSIIENRLGTCLDLSVLFAACAEAAGLHPIIVVVRGHAFFGAWLVDQSFSESVHDDVTLLSKRTAPGVQEICVVESTAVTAGKNCNFDNAADAAERRLHQPDEFHFFVDVRRARIGRILPLPSRVKGVPVENPVDVAPDADFHTAPRDLDAPIVFGQSNDPSDEPSRLAQWERRLLDLSLNNTLLNFRPTSAGIDILAPGINVLEDALFSGKEFEIHPRPVDWSETPRDAAVFRARTQTDAEHLLIQEEFRAGRLRADISTKDLPDRLTQIFRAARTSMEENGANTLFMALGMLSWRPHGEQRARYAPIMLLPMELVRKSVRTGYVLRQGDDDPMFNVTLLEMLKQDFGIELKGLDPLPSDDSGIDVRAVLTLVTRAVMHQAGWEVIESACLGLFSFNKFVMWHDLRERSRDLKKNDVVKSLMAGFVQFDQASDSDPADLEAACARSQIMCPISADSSQLAAIHAVDTGRNIVLHGPPGTGKSQTITNMIANALGKGKTVLFVAEKMAALSVVQKRLARIGLGPFCLELHSNKSRKVQVLEQLGQSMSCGLGSRPADWQAEAERLAQVKGDLNKYVDALHRTRLIGHSIFQGISRLADVADAPDSIRLDEKAVAELDPDRLSRWTTVVHDLMVAARQCADIDGNPWAGCGIQDYTPNVRTRIAESLRDVATTHAGWGAAAARLTPAFSLVGEFSTLETLSAHLALLEILDRSPALPAEMLQRTDWENGPRAETERLLKMGLERDRLRRSVFGRYQPDVLEIEAARLIGELRVLSQHWALPRWIGKRRLTRLMKTYERDDGPGAGPLESDLQEIRRLQELDAAFQHLSDTATGLIGPAWNHGECDWDRISTLLPFVDAVNAQIRLATRGHADAAPALRNAVIEMFAAGRRADHETPCAVDDFLTTGKRAIESWGAFRRLLALTDDSRQSMSQRPGWFRVISDAAATWLAALDGLRDWCAWVRVRRAALDAGLDAVVAAAERGDVAPDQLERTFLRGLYSLWVEHEISGDPVLAGFSRGLFEDRIQTFRELDDTWSKLTCQELYARLAARVPRPARETEQRGELGVLSRELQKQRRHMALRVLFENIPNILPRLKPCLLMSPISVAQYLDPSHPPFDLVIFDEASQVPTCDAVGAIARARQVVIVGDPKQLPPTTFFTRTDSDDDDAVASGDLESILDDCLAINMDQAHLLWHYRSRHESLIAYSNARYYDNRLLTFPSPDDLTPRVRLVPVQGQYERGKTKHNRSEAVALVNEVVRRLRDPVLSGHSIGIVTFNQPQQKLIEDLLDEQLRRTPALEKFFTEGTGECREPVFVKNLENVQGDERDVILFSVGYGPDQSGRVSMNFGPINKDGGQRRLNVAVSRARHEMVVFSSIRADQIDTSRTAARGVADLKAFLEYAHRGVLPIQQGNIPAASGKPARLFANAVATGLAGRGHKVRLGVGKSGYQLDIGIVDSANPGRYVLGVVLDGPSYRDARTVRDRDKLRESVLTGLGWRIHRVWSPEWWENPAREIDRVEQAVAAARKPRSAPTAGEPDGAPDLASDPAVPLSDRNDVTTTGTNALPPTADDNPAPVFVPPPALTAEDMADPRVVPPEIAATAARYRICRLEREPRDPMEFYLPMSDGIIACQATKVTDTEGPICHSLLARRVILAWGMGKIGKRIDDRVDEICRRTGLTRTTHQGRTWYWPITVDPTRYHEFRIPERDDETKREAEEIPPEEIANAMREILRRQISLSERELIKEAADLFGFARVGSTVESSFRYAIGLVLGTGDAAVDAAARIVWRRPDAT